MVPEWSLQQAWSSQSVGLHRAMLSSLSNLRELRIKVKHDHESLEDFMWDDEVVTSFVVDCSGPPNLKILSYSSFNDWSSPDIYQAFAMMLSRLKDLEELSPYSLVED